MTAPSSPTYSRPIPQRPWFRQPLQWSGLAVAIMVIIASIGVMVLSASLRSLGKANDASEADVVAKRKSVEQHEDALRQFQQQVALYRDNRAKLALDNAQFQKELDLMSARTAKLDAIRERLGELQAQYAQYLAAEAQLNENLRTIEQSMPAAK